MVRFVRTSDGELREFGHGQFFYEDNVVDTPSQASPKTQSGISHCLVLSWFGGQGSRHSYEMWTSESNTMHTMSQYMVLQVMYLHQLCDLEEFGCLT